MLSYILFAGLFLFRAGLFSCPVVVHNTGNMRVEDVSLQGDANDCSTALLAPDELVYCTLQRALTEADFVSSTFTMSATGVSGTPRGAKPLQGLSPIIAQRSNPNVSTALLTVSVTANTTVVERAGQAVAYTITLVSAACPKIAATLRRWCHVELAKAASNCGNRGIKVKPALL